jgi:hypothetical protein
MNCLKSDESMRRVESKDLLDKLSNYLIKKLCHFITN